MVAINLIRGYFDKSLEMEITNWDQCGDILLTTRIIQSDDYKKQLCIKVKNLSKNDGQLMKFVENILHSITVIDDHSLKLFKEFVPEFWNPQPFLFLMELWYDNICSEKPDVNLPREYTSMIIKTYNNYANSRNLIRERIKEILILKSFTAIFV